MEKRSALNCIFQGTNVQERFYCLKASFLSLQHMHADRIKKKKKNISFQTLSILGDCSRCWSQLSAEGRVQTLLPLWVHKMMTTLQVSEVFIYSLVLQWLRKSKTLLILKGKKFNWEGQLAKVTMITLSSLESWTERSPCLWWSNDIMKIIPELMIHRYTYGWFHSGLYILRKGILELKSISVQDHWVWKTSPKIVLSNMPWVQKSKKTVFVYSRSPESDQTQELYEKNATVHRKTCKRFSAQFSRSLAWAVQVPGQETKHGVIWSYCTYFALTVL